MTELLEDKLSPNELIRLYQFGPENRFPGKVIERDGNLLIQALLDLPSENSEMVQYFSFRIPKRRNVDSPKYGEYVTFKCDIPVPSLDGGVLPTAQHVRSVREQEARRLTGDIQERLAENAKDKQFQEFAIRQRRVEELEGLSTQRQELLDKREAELTAKEDSLDQLDQVVERHRLRQLEKEAELAAKEELLRRESESLLLRQSEKEVEFAARDESLRRESESFLLLQSEKNAELTAKEELMRRESESLLLRQSEKDAELAVREESLSRELERFSLLQSDVGKRQVELAQLESRWGFLVPKEVLSEEPNEYQSSDFSELYSHFPSFISASDHNSDIEQRFLLCMLSAAKCGSLVLLDGSVGVGKTSIVEKTSQVVTGRKNVSAVIPVRPGWIDSTDLLGFYNPHHREFQPSAFLTALRNAKRYEGQIRLICLDELNLARIENYGADLLSCMEYREERTIPLYSPDIENSLRHEFENTWKEEGHHSGRLLITLKEFPAQYKLPDNVVIVGTLNSDETTYDVSPKVIDRSFVVRMPNIDIRGSQMSRAANLQSCVIGLGEFRKAVDVYTAEQRDAQWFRERLVELQQSISDLGIPLGHRAWRDVQTFAAVARAVGLDQKEAIYQHFLHVKILPRIRCQKSQSTQRAWKELHRLLGSFLQEDRTDVVKNLNRQWDDPSIYSIRYFGVNQ